MHVDYDRSLVHYADFLVPFGDSIALLKPSPITQAYHFKH